jgi:hypothetical protein
VFIFCGDGERIGDFAFNAVGLFGYLALGQHDQ